MRNERRVHPAAAVAAAAGLLAAASSAWSAGAEPATAGTGPAALQRALELLEVAEVTYESARLQEAIAVLDQLARQEPSNARYFYYLGRAYFPLINVHDYQGDAKTAEKVGEQGLEHARTAIRLDGKGNPDAYRLLGDYYGRLSGYQGVFGRMRYGGRSMKFHKKAREMDPQSVLGVIGEGTDKLFAPSAFGGDANEAVGLFTTAVGMQPGSALGHVWLARSYLKLKKPALAREHFEKALALEPQSGFARGEYERAKPELPRS
jgi:tetratricopeptide (TPR) repeat protein